MSLTFHVVVSEVDPWNECFMCKRLGAKIFCELLKKDVPWKSCVCVCMCVCVAAGGI